MAGHERKTGLRYRAMSSDDLPAVFAVRLSTIENAITMERLEEDYGITPESLAEAMKSHVQGWLCEDSERVVGFSMGDRGNGEVQVVAVLPEFEGLGIGRSLLERVAAWLFTAGRDQIWLAATPDPKIRAYGFYRRLGWRSTGEMIEDDEVMVLRRSQDEHGDDAPGDRSS